MKLYILPVEKVCESRCSWCITKFRKTIDGQFISLEDVLNVLSRMTFEKIEITGGGEPTIHKNISEIIKLCSTQAKTQLYTHGRNIAHTSNLELLDTLCVSIAHYNSSENLRIMGVSPDLETISTLRVPVKFSLLAHKSGINSTEELRKYLNWARQHADRIVVRQLFDHDYKGKVDDEFVSTEKLFHEFGTEKFTKTPHGNPVIEYSGVEVEFEYRSCACETSNPVLHANGKLYRGWTEEKI
jgi:organic radical activating enzyme